MQNRSMPFFSIFLVLLFFTASQVHATLISTFDTDAEGWWVTAGAQNGTWNSSGGNPGGYVSAEEALLNNTWYFGSPDSWKGDWTAYIGGTVSFDLIDIEKDWDDAYGGVHGDYYDHPFEIVVVMDQDNRARWHADIVPPLLGDWKSFQISLLESTVDLKPGGTESFATIMANVNRLLIRGEYYRLDDKTGLDNVMVRVPEPATLLLMASTLLGLGFAQHKKKKV